ncbi:hypothetical protein [Komagataeibacter saccharivorans]|uniref:hypothetical protein n=1 Tax=Komagataeibacter saccharivorans TaxID=265959 RepID=UPI0039E778B5
MALVWRPDPVFCHPVGKRPIDGREQILQKQNFFWFFLPGYQLCRCPGMKVRPVTASGLMLEKPGFKVLACNGRIFAQSRQAAQEKIHIFVSQYTDFFQMGFKKLPITPFIQVFTIGKVPFALTCPPEM